MQAIRKVIAVTTLAVAFSSFGAVSFAQDHPQDGPHSSYVKHSEWHKGAKIQQEDWNRGAQVDWHAHHLTAPRAGYEWREVDGNYVLAAVATGIIASTIIAAGR
jgi:Ni/Co efflux regulator RcnB